MPCLFRHVGRLVAGAIVLFFTALAQVSAGGLLDRWSWAGAPAPVPSSRGVDVSIGSYFGDNDLTITPDMRQEYGGSRSYWSGVVRRKASDLLARPGGGFAFINLPTDGIGNVKSIQVGVFDITGLGDGFDDSGSKTIEIAHRRKIPAVVGECGLVSPARTIVEIEKRSYAETTDDTESMSGVEFNVVLDDQLVFGGASGLQTFAGARFINYGDSYLAASSNSSTEGGSHADAQSLAVNNHLVGGQVGVSGKKFLSSRVLLTGRVAAGLFANFASRGGSFSAFGNGGPGYAFEESSNDTGFAQMLEFSPALHIKLRDDMFVSFGGSVMLLNGVSEADRSAAAGFEASRGRSGDSGTYLFYGGRATLKWTFD